MMKTIPNVKVSEQVKASDSASCDVIYNFAWQHLKASTIFRDHVRELEDSGQPWEKIFDNIRSYSSGTIMSATASLEALINEFFISPQHKLRPKLQDFEEQFWGKGGIERKSILDKYNKALKLLDLPILGVESHAYMDAKALIDLRNILVHYKPNWDPNPKLDKDASVKNLKGRYELSPFFNEGTNADFITFRSMSAGCATWAVQSALNFIREFDERAKLDSKKMFSFWLLDEAKQAAQHQ